MRSFILLLKRIGLQKIIAGLIALVLIIIASVYLYNRPLTLDPNIQTLLDQNKYTDSIPKIEKWLSQNPNDINAKELLAATYIQKAEAEPKVAYGYLNKAITILLSNVKADKNRDESFRLLGTIATIRTNFKAAEDYFSRALSINPNNIQAQLGKARIVEHNNDWAKAYGLYNTVLKQDPNNTLASLGMARYYVTQNNFDDAYASAKKVLDISKNYSEIGEANHIIGSMMMARGLYEKAITYYKESLTYRPGNVHTIVLEGEANIELYKKSGNKTRRTAFMDEAVSLAKKALDTYPTYIYALALQYKVYLLQNNYSEANKIAKQIIGLLDKDRVLTPAEKTAFKTYYSGDITSVKINSSSVIRK